jgi:hypothetical protein
MLRRAEQDLIARDPIGLSRLGRIPVPWLVELEDL